MRVFVVALVASLVYLASARPEGKYTTKYDNIDLDQIIKNDRLMHNYVKCLLDQGNCSPDGAELKKTLPDAIHTDCAKCSEKQKEGSKKIMRHLIDNKPEWWKQLEAKYDKDGTYKKKYQDEKDANLKI
ncbi:chemosensory protein [Rhyzopertha dominica]|uniref:Chemosensory protein 6 n=1 Tax=Rhyzopertha dominica TaxID=92692 RepID=A0A0X8T3E2_RHYDO|nr:chemosensory protein 6 [Rhyzopertha dominica]KAI7815307.1 chemosensory protein [Rhyzopertha dominica]